MSLWTSTEAAKATGGTTTGWQATGVSIDTRTLQPGDLFVALSADRDGHDFVAAALAKGTSAMAPRQNFGINTPLRRFTPAYFIHRQGRI